MEHQSRGRQGSPVPGMPTGPELLQQQRQAGLRGHVCQAEEEGVLTSVVFLKSQKEVFVSSRHADFKCLSSLAG